MTALNTAYPIGEALRQNYNFKDAKHVVDIGGGVGSLLVDILRHEPHLTATDFDLVLLSKFYFIILSYLFIDIFLK